MLPRAQDFAINAKIDKSVSLALGQMMSFEVKANSSSFMSLAPLYVPVLFKLFDIRLRHGQPQSRHLYDGCGIFSGEIQKQSKASETTRALDSMGKGERIRHLQNEVRALKPVCVPFDDRNLMYGNLRYRYRIVQ